MAQQIPQAGEVFMVDGRPRRVVEVDLNRNKLRFGAVDEAAEAERQAAVTAWKKRRDEYVAGLKARLAAGEIVNDEEWMEEALITAIGPAPETSPNGTCALHDVRKIDTPNGPIWYLNGRLEARKVAEGAVVLETAAFHINKQ